MDQEQRKAGHPDGHRTQQNGHQAAQPRPRGRCQVEASLSVSLPVTRPTSQTRGSASATAHPVGRSPPKHAKAVQERLEQLPLR